MKTFHPFSNPFTKPRLGSETKMKHNEDRGVPTYFMRKGKSGAESVMSETGFWQSRQDLSL